MYFFKPRGLSVKRNSLVSNFILYLYISEGLNLVCANSNGSGHTARMRRLIQTFAVRIYVFCGQYAFYIRRKDNISWRQWYSGQTKQNAYVLQASDTNLDLKNEANVTI